MAFEDKLQHENEQGIFILDSRNKVKNVPVAHGIFTMKFSAHGTGYDYLAELPLFGHSENHAMLQLADWVGSAFLCPMAVRAYYPNLENVCVHADAIFDLVRNRFGQRTRLYSIATSVTATSSAACPSSLAATAKSAPYRSSARNRQCPET